MSYTRPGAGYPHDYTEIPALCKSRHSEQSSTNRTVCDSESRNSPELGCRFVPALAVTLAIIAIGLAGRALNPVFINDQLELLEFSARWQWAYDEQMPVYAWVSTALLRLTGDSVLALDALKYLWVGGMLLALAGIAERLRPGSGVIAIAFAFLLPTVNDDLMGEVSHTAAMMCAGAVSAWLIVRALDGETRRLWLWLGLVWAGGLAAKHSMVPLVAAEFAAVALLAGPVRARMLRHMVPAAGIMVALCAPLYVILAMAPDTVGDQLAEFFTDRGLAGALMDGLTSPLAEAGVLIVGIAGVAVVKRPVMGRARWVLIAVCAGFVAAIIGGVLQPGLCSPLPRHGRRRQPAWCERRHAEKSARLTGSRAMLPSGACRPSPTAPMPSAPTHPPCPTGTGSSTVSPIWILAMRR